MSWTLIAHANAKGGNTQTTPAFDATGANLLVAIISNDQETLVAAPTDSEGNTWTVVATYGLSPNQAVTIAYVANPIVSSSMTVSCDLFYGSFAVAAFGGATASPLDQYIGSTQASASDIQAGSLTPSQSGALVIAGLGYRNTGDATINDSFSITDIVPFVSGDYVGVGLAYLAPGSAGAVNPTWSWSGSNIAAASIASFLPASTSTTLTADSGATSAWQGGLTRSAAAGAEASSSSRGDGAALVAMLAQTRRDIAAPGEFPAALAADEIPTLALVAASRSEAIAGAEWTGAIGIVVDGTAALEWIANLDVTADEAAVIEWSVAFDARVASLLEALGLRPAPAQADPVFIARGPLPRFIARGPALRFIAIGRVGMRTNDLSPPIAAGGESRAVTFDFGPQLAAGVTITGITAMNASVHWGFADPTPDARWQGEAAIIASPSTGAAAQAVVQLFGDAPGATVYLLQCVATASDGSEPALETTVTSYVPS